MGRYRSGRSNPEHSADSCSLDSQAAEGSRIQQNHHGANDEDRQLHDERKQGNEIRTQDPLQNLAQSQLAEAGTEEYNITLLQNRIPGVKYERISIANSKVCDRQKR